jgi:Dna[CI] antecedent, DciA
MIDFEVRSLKSDTAVHFRLHTSDFMNPIGSVVPGAIVALLRDTPLSAGKVTFAWNAAVGPAVQRATSVQLEDGVLLVDASSPQWAREVSRSTPIILRRLQHLLGDATVTRIAVRTK